MANRGEAHEKIGSSMARALNIIQLFSLRGRRVPSLLLLLAILLPATLVAQRLALVAEANKTTLKVGERLKLTYSISAAGSQFKPPHIPDFRLISGPNPMQQMEIIGNKVSAKTSYTMVLVALKEGDYNIGAASLVANGQTYMSQNLKVKVEKGSPNSGGQSSKGQTARNDLYMRIHLNKTKVYRGEQVVATVKLYSKHNLADGAIEVEPSFDSFYKKSVQVADKGYSKPEVVNGQRYNVVLMDQVVLIPQKSGEITIDPYKMNVEVRVPAGRNRYGNWSFFRSPYKNVEMTVKSNSPTVQVLDLPTVGQPANYQGIVGSYELETELTQSELSSNDGSKLKVKVKGKGNLYLLKEPDIKFPNEFKVFDPEITDNIRVNGYGISGDREYAYSFIPRYAGEYTIEGLTMPIFDPAKGEYVVLKSEPVKINVSKGDHNDGGALVNINKSKVEELGTDIRHIKTGPTDLSLKAFWFFKSSTYFVALGSPMLLFFLLLVFRKRYEDYLKNTSLRNRRKAGKTAEKRLAAAKKLMGKGDSGAFYDEVIRAIYGFLGNKLNLEQSGMNRQTITSLLTQNQVSEAVINKLVTTLDECEMARFTPVSDVSEGAMFAAASELINQLEDTLK